MTRAMIFAAGRGDRMRPLTDHTPKPLLTVGGKPLIVWQIERLAAAGVRDIVINHAWLGAQIETALGDGSAWGVRLAYSPEGQALETAGGVAQAMPLLHAGDGHSVFIAVSGDVFCDYDYALLRDRAPAMAAQAAPGMHLVMVPNPPYHLRGDFALDNEGMLHTEGAERLTFGNIGLYDTRLFAGIAPGTRLAMTPLYHQAIAEGRATGERFDGRWENVGTPAQLAALDAEIASR
ncbi:N-acetylmuramate alpha-1-phosphate uridylyltransferase [Ralstonia pickettii]|jgi:N-acetyl-alpha-D-muramate 1-phosphate uridylyltransferase|uniref:N-acetylmuramate alpha-1-phosphate uridylyltransferase n=3 Tax=Ralstonia pickettii TaxID=329 RepID=A0ABM9IR18_RALPI|nr:N-acetylmuramate alpha-1-phosphate uridylyltransferase [Ralstonia pickettii]